MLSKSGTTIAVLFTLAATAAQAECGGPLTFAASADHGGDMVARASATITGDEVCTYTFAGEKGLILDVGTDNTDLEYHLLTPYEAMLDVNDPEQGGHIMTATGDYTLVVGQNRDDARKGEPAKFDAAFILYKAVAGAETDIAMKMAEAAGTYQGVIPCASCEGIEYSLNLFADGTYTRTQDYKGGDLTVQDSGTWAYNDLNLIVLSSEEKDEPATYIAQSLPGVLEIVDQEGNSAEGMAEAYQLSRQ